MIVGTAGHIDHGKTALVKALTGVDADRLPEERARGISIDLGFAYLPRPDGSVMGFVDVPGHERFMKAMLAGATGMDFVLLVVAADDGVMPQTREHLAVAELLGLTRGAVALTKCDLVDAQRLAQVEHEVRQLLASGPLAGAPIIRTSATTGEGVEAVLAHLDAASNELPPPSRGSVTRFAVDRSFSLQGIGTVVTGILWSGEIAPGDMVTVSPAGLPARVRALHVQNHPAERARAGDRCGVNLGRTEASAVKRGDFLLEPSLHAPAERIDASLRLLASEPRPLRHWTAVRVHHGAAEVPARIALLREEPLAPGEEGLVQLVLDHPIAAAVGDRFVVRSADASRTMGGGRLIDLRAPHRRRKRPQRLQQLAAMALPDHAASLAAQLECWPWVVERQGFVRDRAIRPTDAGPVLQAVPHVAAGGFLFGAETWERLVDSALGEARRFHERFPQLLGPSVRRLTDALDPRLPTVPAQAALDRMVELGVLAREAGIYRLPDHRLGLDRDDDATWRAVVPLLGGEARFRPPRVDQLAASLHQREFDCRRVLKAMSKQGAVVEIAPDHFFLRTALGEIARIVDELARESEDGRFGAAQLRDRLNNGRKVSIQLLEWFDRQGLTLRREDLRIIDPARLVRFAGEAAGAG